MVYAKTPLGGAAQVLGYLSRYNHRTAIGNERILSMSNEDAVFSVRADDQSGKRRMRLPTREFIHVLTQSCVTAATARSGGACAHGNNTQPSVPQQALRKRQSQPTQARLHLWEGFPPQPGWT